MPELVPELRFPEFDANWQEYLFKEVYSFKTTNSLSRDNLNYISGKVRNIHYGDIHTKFKSLFDLKNEHVPFINEDIDLSRIPDECYVQKGDLIIADASEDYEDVGKAIEIQSLNNEKVLAGLHTFLARKESNVIVDGFASFLLKTRKVRLLIMKIAQGTKVLGISSYRLGEITIVIPTQPEQKKITLFLSSIDQRIQMLEEKKKQLERYKQGVMQKIFTQEIRFKDENENDFPAWEEKKIGSIVEYYDGTHQTPKYVEDGIPFYSVEHVTVSFP